MTVNRRSFWRETKRTSKIYRFGFTSPAVKVDTTLTDTDPQRPVTNNQNAFDRVLMSDFDQRFPNGWRVWSDSTETPSEVTTDPNSREMRELDLITGNGPAKTRKLPLKALVPLLIDAHHCDSTWLQDFADDNVVIDADLHDVLLAFQNICSDIKRQSALNTDVASTLTRRRDRDAA